MRTHIAAAAVAAAVLASAAPATASSIPGPPLDPIYYEPGGGCDPSPDPQPCDPVPPRAGYDKTYPSRLIDWAKDALP